MASRRRESSEIPLLTNKIARNLFPVERENVDNVAEALYRIIGNRKFDHYRGINGRYELINSLPYRLVEVRTPNFQDFNNQEKLFHGNPKSSSSLILECIPYDYMRGMQKKEISIEVENPGIMNGSLKKTRAGVISDENLAIGVVFATDISNIFASDRKIPYFRADVFILQEYGNRQLSLFR